jgi:DNA-binding transcriptional LysR family regulator
MTDITTAHIRRLDMTLLVVFVELVRHRKLTVVAERLGLTQSAISHALKRLRDIFDDELFLRRSNGVEPTSRALALEPKIAAIVGLTVDALNIQREFDPAREERIVSVAATDSVASIYSAPIIEHLRVHAPHMRISFRSAVRKQALDAISDGTIDLAIGFFYETLSKEFGSRHLFDDGYSVIARSGHPISRGDLSLKRYLGSDHLLISLSGEMSGIVDTTLEALGEKRRVVATVPLFMQALGTIAETDLICTVPARLAHHHAARFGLAIMKPPLPIRPLRITALWHRRTAADPALMWLRDQIGQLVR